MGTIKPIRFLRTGAFACLHIGWWYVATASVAVFLFSLWYSYDLYLTVCEGAGCSIFQLSSKEAADLSGIGISVQLYAAVVTILIALQFLTFFAIGGYLCYYGRKDVVAVFVSLLLISTGVSLGAQPEAIAASPNVASHYHWLGFAGYSYLFFAFLYPDGRFHPRWMIVPATIGLIGTVGMYAFEGSFLDPNVWPIQLRTVTFLGIHAMLAASQIYRYRRTSTDDQRRQTRWFVVSLAIFVGAVGFSLSLQNVEHGVVKLATWVGFYGGLLFMPFAVGMSVLEARLRSMSVLFNRTVIYVLMSFFIVCAYILTVGVLGLAMNQNASAVVALGATGVSAMLFQPIRDRLQRGVNRLVYGAREEPYEVISQLTRQLEASFANASVLPIVVERVATALRIPYAAIEPERVEGTVEPIASYGRRGKVTSDVPLVLEGERVGTLVLGVSNWRDALPPGGHMLLDDLVRHVAIAVRAERLWGELQQTRERLVTAREEERSRLQKDLHDGLGASLAAIGLKFDQIRRTFPLARELEEAIADMQMQLKETIGGLRRLVYSLRPLELDELGFALALRELQYQFINQPVRITVEVEEHLPTMSAAVEVTAYRIVQECISNAIRHSNATRCSVQTRVEGDRLIVEVSDDGVGMPAEPRAGIGLRSVKERAQEVGGSLLLRSKPNEGTSVLVTIPIREGSGHG